MPGQAGELLPHPAGGDTFKAVAEAGQRDLGREVDQQVNVVAFAVELRQLGLEVRADVPHDLFQAFQVLRGEYRMPVLGHENQMRVQDKHAVPASAYVPMTVYETNYTEGVRLRYNYRLYPAPGQRSALARPFGCARVVFNDSLRARQDAYAAGLPYITDAELSARLTAAKATPERAWLGEVSAVVLQQAQADLNTSVHYAGWSAFTSMLEDKALKPGRTFARTGRVQPTSHVCSACGVKDGPKP